jgi:hypothetical protein
MAVRIREDGKILCAAMFPKEDGDIYIDDALHYRLSVELKILVTEQGEKHKLRGEWWWKPFVPKDIEIDSFYYELPESNQSTS